MTKNQPRRSRALVAMAAVIGVLVAIGAYSYGSASDRTPTASVQMVLDEDQTGWPFYAAIQEEAEALIDDDAVVQAALERSSSGSGELSVDRPGDLSIFSVVATAPNDEAAIALADAGAAELADRNQAVRRATETIELDALRERASSLEAELATAANQVDSLAPDDQSADAILARSSLDARGRELNDLNRQIADLETQIETIGPSFRALSGAQLATNSTSSALTALTAGAAAAVLSLLALSFLAGPQPSATAAPATALPATELPATASPNRTKASPVTATGAVEQPKQPARVTQPARAANPTSPAKSGAGATPTVTAEAAKPAKPPVKEKPAKPAAPKAADIAAKPSKPLFDKSPSPAKDPGVKSSTGASENRADPKEAAEKPKTRRPKRKR